MPDYFNPRSRTGSDPTPGLLRWGDTIFQPTLPHRERRNFALGIPPPLGDFNPRSRTGSDDVVVVFIGVDLVNFNPRSRTGSDWRLDTGCFSHWYFNPRSRTGSDLSENRKRDALQHFNPRSRTGSDMSILPMAVIPIYFNPRSRTGSDLGLAMRFHLHSLFQPTLPHRERRFDVPDFCIGDFISTHAPAQGATWHFQCSGAFL